MTGKVNADLRAGRRNGLRPDIEEDIKHFVKTRLAAHEYPREIECVSELPVKTTGRIMRKELRALELERKVREMP